MKKLKIIFLLMLIVAITGVGALCYKEIKNDKVVVEATLI